MTFDRPRRSSCVVNNERLVGIERPNDVRPNIIGSESHEKNGYGTKSNVYTQTGPFSVSVNEKGFAESEGSAGWGDNAQIDFDASRSNQIYGASETVQPSALRALACIKF